MTQIDLLNNHQIVTLAVALLGGDTDHVDREDVAIKAHEIAPGKFSWRKYPNRIDLDAVGIALRDAKKEKNGELLIGNNTRGWMLGPNGFRWILSLRFEKELDFQLIEKSSSAISYQQAERERLYQTNAYNLFVDSKDDEITQHDFFQFVRANEYFKEKARERRYTIIENAVVGDEILSKLWNYLKHKFI